MSDKCSIKIFHFKREEVHIKLIYDTVTPSFCVVQTIKCFLLVLMVLFRFGNMCLVNEYSILIKRRQIYFRNMPLRKRFILFDNNSANKKRKNSDSYILIY